MPISGRRRVIPMGFRGAANWRNKPADPRKSRALRGFAPFHGRGAAPRGRSPVNHPPFLSKPEPSFAARPRPSSPHLLMLPSIPSALHHLQFEPRATPSANVAYLPARVAEPVPRSVAIRRNRRRDRLFHRARDRPAGSLFGIRTNSHHDDRPR